MYTVEYTSSLTELHLIAVGGCNACLVFLCSYRRRLGELEFSVRAVAQSCLVALLRSGVWSRCCAVCTTRSCRLEQVGTGLFISCRVALWKIVSVSGSDVFLLIRVDSLLGPSQPTSSILTGELFQDALCRLEQQVHRELALLQQFL